MALVYWVTFIFHSGYRKINYIRLTFHAILMITKHLKGKKKTLSSILLLLDYLALVTKLITGKVKLKWQNYAILHPSTIFNEQSAFLF